MRQVAPHTGQPSEADQENEVDSPIAACREVAQQKAAFARQEETLSTSIRLTRSREPRQGNRTRDVAGGKQNISR